MTTPFRRHLKWVVLVAFGIGGVLMGVIAERLAAKVEHERASALAEEYFAGRTAAFVREMREVTEELEHIRSFFVASRHVSRAEFRVFAGEILSRHPAILAVEWAPRVSGADRLRHEREARAEGLPGYQIRVLGPAAGPGPHPRSPSTTPSSTWSRSRRNRDVLGVDLSSEPARLAAMVRADATGEPSASPPVDLDPGRRNRQGFPDGAAGRRPDRGGAEPGRRAARWIRPPDGTGAWHLPRPAREERAVGRAGHALRVG